MAEIDNVNDDKVFSEYHSIIAYSKTKHWSALQSLYVAITRYGVAIDSVFNALLNTIGQAFESTLRYFRVNNRLHKAKIANRYLYSNKPYARGAHG